jgi:hypothetical protein
MTLCAAPVLAGACMVAGVAALAGAVEEMRGSIVSCTFGTLTFVE